MSSGDAVQQIKDRLSIVDVVSSYVELHKAGRHYKGKSPFTNEKTPSFYVSPDRGMYYCFSTSQGGDMFTFIQTMEGMEFKDALKLLAEKANVELVPESPEKRSQRDQLLSVMTEATQWFAEQREVTVLAEQYLAKRGLTTETIKKWQIGYAPGPPLSGWRGLRDHLKAKGYADTVMLQAGLIKTGQAGKDPFDVFRDRIMFPMRDQSGRVVAFSGRVLHADTEAPKYVNSPETELYHKSSFLFGYDMAKQAARQLDFWLVVEGQFDVVLAHQAGYANTVAVSGTAFTPHHLQLLERLSSRVVLALDADRAGIAAMYKAAQLMLRRGLDVKVAQLTPGSDPADMIVSDKQTFKKAVGGAVHVVEFMLQHILSTVTEERAQKLQAHDQVLPLIAAIPNRVDQEYFEQLTATKLGTTKDAIHFELERIRESLTKAETPREVTAPDVPATPVAQSVSPNADRVLHSTFAYLHAVQLVVTESDQKVIQQHLEGIPGFVMANYSERVTPETQSKLTFMLETFMEEQSPRVVYEEITHRLNQFRTQFLKNHLRTLRETIAQAEHGGGEPSAEVLGELLTVQKELQQTPLEPDIFKI